MWRRTGIQILQDTEIQELHDLLGFLEKPTGVGPKILMPRMGFSGGLRVSGPPNPVQCPKQKRAIRIGLLGFHNPAQGGMGFPAYTCGQPES